MLHVHIYTNDGWSVGLILVNIVNLRFQQKSASMYEKSFPAI